MLLRDGAFDAIQDNYGQTPLHYAVSNGDASLVDILMSCLNYDVADDSGRRPIDLAAAAGYPDLMVRIVREYGHHVMSEYYEIGNIINSGTW